MQHVNELLSKLLHVIEPLRVLRSKLLSEINRLLAQRQNAIFHKLERLNH